MRKKTIAVLITILIITTVLLFTGCGNGKYAESDTLIISTKDVLSLFNKGGWTMLDAQKTTSYEKEHVAGAVNIQRAQINVKTPVANTLAPGAIVAEAAGKAGLSADSNVLIYDDNNNMDSGRLAWTLLTYGHTGDIRIISGGLAALKKAGVELTAGVMTGPAAVYEIKQPDPVFIIGKNKILDWVNNPSENMVILDVRSDEEYNAGTIPSSVHVEYLENNFPDGTYKPVQHIRIIYKEMGIMPEDNVIMFCKSSIRATQSFAALYNAGYRNLKVYDGAWLEWSADPDLPIYKPEVPSQVQIRMEDAS